MMIAKRHDEIETLKLKQDRENANGSLPIDVPWRQTASRTKFHAQNPPGRLLVIFALLFLLSLAYTPAHGWSVPLTNTGRQRMSISSLPMNPMLLEKSRNYCEHITRTQAKNFYYGLKLLPDAKRAAMFALYAYMRRVDDIADDEDGRSIPQRLGDLEHWRGQTRTALEGQLDECAADPVWPALIDAVGRYHIPAMIFDEVIEGQRQDLEPIPIHNFEELQTYCYRVAGVVGLSSIHVWGYQGGEETEALAVDRGVAFQLTNILRDLREDAARGRCYLPTEELSAMKLSAEDLLQGGNEFREMMRFQINRAERFYQQSAALEDRIDRDSRPTLRAMTEIYHGLLKKIAADPERVLSERVSLSVLSKLRIGWRRVEGRLEPSFPVVHRANFFVRTRGFFNTEAWRH